MVATLPRVPRLLPADPCGTTGDAPLPYSVRLFPNRLSISPEEFGRATGLGRTSTYLAIGRGEIPVKRVGRRLLIPLSALDAWLSQNDAPSAV